MNRTHLFLNVNTSICENVAPPDKFEVLYCLLPIEFIGFNSRMYFKGNFWFWYYLHFLKGTGPFKINNENVNQKNDID